MPLPSLDNWNVLFLIAGAQGLLLVLAMLSKKKHPPFIFLVILTFLFSINIFEYVAFWTNYRFVWPHIDKVSLAFPLLYGPLIYFYLMSFIKDIKVKRKHLLHLIPFCIIFIYKLPYYLSSAEKKMAAMTPDPNWFLNISLWERIDNIVVSGLPFLITAHLIFYAYLSFKIVRSTKGEAIKGPTQKWIYLVWYSFVGFSLSFISYYVMVYLFRYNLISDYLISLFMCLFIYSLGYYAFKAPETFDGYIKDHIAKQKYMNSGLDSQNSHELKHKLLKAMNEEKLFLKSDLKLEHIASQLGASRHHISQVINDEFDSTFSKFINSYRIEEAKKLIADKHSALNMHGIALESGFKNQTTFNLAFKRHTGKNPSSFKK